MIKVIQVVANDDFSIHATLEDGRIIRLEMGFIKKQNGPVVDPLHNLSEFKNVFVRNGVVTWPSGYDIDPYFLVENGVVTNKSA